ncbi:MAG: tetratricopeptide repeat protein, partial [Pyrinomonadaceae bacterium]
MTEPPVFRASDSINLITPDDGARVKVYQEFGWQVLGANATYVFSVRDKAAQQTVLQKELNETSYLLNEKDAGGLVSEREYFWSVVGRLGAAESRSPERRFVFEGRKPATVGFTNFDADARTAFEKRFREAGQADLPMLQQKLEGYLKTHEGVETPDVAWAHQMLGSIFYRRDDRSASRDHYAAALSLWEHLGIPDEVMYARTLNNYGLVNQDAGKFERALTLYTRALAVYGGRDDDLSLRRRGDCHLNIGTVYRELGLPERALEQYKAALEIDKRQDNKGAMAEDLNNIGNLYVDELDNPTLGVEFIRDSLAKHREVAQQSGRPRETMADTLDSLGVAYTRLGDVVAARENFSEAIELDTDRSNDTGLLQTTNNLAELDTDYETALDHYKNALDIVGRSEDADPDEVWRVYDGLGRAYLMAGNFGEAEANLKKAIEVLEGLRGSLSEEDFRRTFRLDRQSPYHNLGRLRLRQSDLAGVFDAIESSRAASLRASRAMREGGETRAAPPPLDQMRQALGEGDVALEYFFASRKAPVLLLAVMPGQVFGYELSTREEFDKLVKPLVRDIANGADAASTREQLSELSRRLFPEQLLEQMRRGGARRVLISQDGVLHHLPFELLPAAGPDGETRYLLEWLEVSVTPSLRWWYETRAEAARLNGKQRDMLVVADPAVNPAGCEV